MPCQLLQPGCVSNNVLIGHNGQLFLFEGHYNQFAYLTGAASVQPKSQANFLSNLRQRRYTPELPVALQAMRACFQATSLE